MNHHGDMTQTPADDGAREVVVTNNQAARRYEAHIGTELVGLTTYLLDQDRVVFTHAEVYPKWEGRGVGSALARGALDDVIGQGKLITPKCPFVVDYVKRHPSYLEHVDPWHRSQLEATASDSTEREGV
jgi:predicted GNAT family acetyltransferase